jgi:hypothetical protein
MFINMIAVHIPLRTRADVDVTRVQNTNTMNNKLNKRNDSLDMMSDDYDSDSKENENVSFQIRFNSMVYLLLLF